jgi:hypothetical protein
VGCRSAPLGCRVTPSSRARPSSGGVPAECQGGGGRARSDSGGGIGLEGCRLTPALTPLLSAEGCRVTPVWTPLRCQMTPQRRRPVVAAWGSPPSGPGLDLPLADEGVGAARHRAHRDAELLGHGRGGRVGVPELDEAGLLGGGHGVSGSLGDWNTGKSRQNTRILVASQSASTSAVSSSSSAASSAVKETLK